MTALAHMAAARPPGIADARVPCPLCGGLIHPVAGKCKHCKEDLTTYRAGRPQAAAALPSLNGKPHGTNGHAVIAAPVPVVPVAEPIVREGSAPILPQRPTGRSMAAQRKPRGSLLKNWPMIVIALAAVAIVTATVIMVLPAGSKKTDNKLSNPPAPAPERMDLNPMPAKPDKQSQVDPWGSPGGAPNPAMPNAPVPQPAPADPDDDIWGQLGPSNPGGGGGLTNPFGSPGSGQFMVSALDHACKKMTSCPDIDQKALASICSAVAMMPKPPATTCQAAKRCLDKIDAMTCSQASNATPQTVVFQLFQDCTDAALQC